MKILLLVVVGLLSITVCGQLTKIQSLDTSDQLRAVELWKAKQKADSDWAAFQYKIKEKYTYQLEYKDSKGSSRSWMSQSMTPEGEKILECQQRAGFDPFAEYNWQYGFEFDSEFKYIIAKPVPACGQRVSGHIHCPELTRRVAMRPAMKGKYE